MTETSTPHIVLPDAVRDEFQRRNAEPPDLKDLRAGKTVAWFEADANRRLESCRTAIRHARKVGDETRKVVSHRTVIDGKPAVVAWLVEDAPKEGAQ